MIGKSRFWPRAHSGKATFSMFVISAMRLLSWKMTDTCSSRCRARAASSNSETRLRFTSISPASGTSRPASRLISVLFPDPLSPMRACRPDDENSISTLRSASTRPAPTPKDLDTPTAAIILVPSKPVQQEPFVAQKYSSQPQRHGGRPYPPSQFSLSRESH